MRYYKTEGLIYKVNEYKDYDFIVSILSPSFGKITVVARGVRRPKSRKSSHIDIFNFNNFTLVKGKKGIESISETKITENFRIFRNKYPFYLFYLAELIDKISVDETDAKNIYELIFIALKLADIDDFVKFIAVIELKLLKIIGLEPQLTHFTDTTEKFKIDDNFYTNYELPGYLSRGDKNYKVNAEIIKCQRFMLNENLRSQKMLKIGEETLDKILKINKIWIQNSLEIKLKSIKFLNL